jgi:hypothetical protein
MHIRSLLSLFAYGETLRERRESVRVDGCVKMSSEERMVCNTTYQTHYTCTHQSTVSQHKCLRHTRDDKLHDGDVAVPRCQIERIRTHLPHIHTPWPSARGTRVCDRVQDETRSRVFLALRWGAVLLNRTQPGKQGKEGSINVRDKWREKSLG